MAEKKVLFQERNIIQLVCSYIRKGSKGNKESRLLNRYKKRNIKCLSSVSVKFSLQGCLLFANIIHITKVDFC